MLALACIVVPTLLFATGTDLRDSRRPLVHPLVHDRYVFVPAIVFVLLAVRALRPDASHLRRWCGAGIVIAALVQGAAGYRSSMQRVVHDGQPQWRAEIARVGETGGPARVWPPRFVVHVPAAAEREP